MHQDHGLTLIELLAGMVIASIVLAAAVSLSLYVSSQVNQLLQYSQAQRQVMQMSYRLTSLLKQSDWVQLSWSSSGKSLTSATTVDLQLYQGGTYERANGKPGSYAAGIYTNGSLQNATATGRIELSAPQYTDPSAPSPVWQVSYIPSGTGSQLQALGTMGVALQYPTTIKSGSFVNSLVVDLWEPYTLSGSQTGRFILTMGYHDKDLR